VFPADRPRACALLAAATAAAASAALLCTPAPSRAWGPLGHQAVGAVADARLTDASRAQIAALLAGDLGRDGAPSGRTTLAQVSTWADEIRGSDADRPRWHYDNLPACRAVPTSPDWCAGDQCASARVAQLLAVLADPQRPPRERNEALKWVVHLVGDLHQPLHAVDYADGANRVAVALEAAGRRPDRHPLTLHGAWDVYLADAALHVRGGQPLPQAAVRTLLVRAAHLDPALLRAPVHVWLDESNALARAVALDYPGFGCGEPPRAPVRLSRGYQRRAQRVIADRLALAGARLADALNRALDPH
jgi:hypothetical protein